METRLAENYEIKYVYSRISEGLNHEDTSNFSFNFSGVVLEAMLLYAASEPFIQGLPCGICFLIFRMGAMLHKKKIGNCCPRNKINFWLMNEIIAFVNEDEQNKAQRVNF